MLPRVRIVGVGQTPIGRLSTDSVTLALNSMRLAMDRAQMRPRDIDALIATPSLSDHHFMHAHYLATKGGLVKANPGVLLKTIDAGGAGPISALSTALAYIQNGWANTVAIVASDAVNSLPSHEFATRSNGSIPAPDLPEPHIPHGYDRYAQWQMQRYGLTREQLAMVPVLMSNHAARHPDAMCKSPYTLEEVLQSRSIAPVTNLLECARRADGGVTLILAKEEHYASRFASGPLGGSRPVILGLGEASGPLYPPPLEEITEELFSCHRAAGLAYRMAGVTPADIGFFGLYDCFPICFLRALESVGLCGEGEGGAYVERAYHELQQKGVLQPCTFPINTHGGLMCFGAPWEVPAMYNVTESIAQLSGAAGTRQVTPVPQRALVYGNGGVFSASAVAILAAEG